jgi:hypothetical protein
MWKLMGKKKIRRKMYISLRGSWENEAPIEIHKLKKKKESASMV